MPARRRKTVRIISSFWLVGYAPLDINYVLDWKQFWNLPISRSSSLPANIIQSTEWISWFPLLQMSERHSQLFTVRRPIFATLSGKRWIGRVRIEPARVGVQFSPKHGAFNKCHSSFIAHYWMELSFGGDDPVPNMQIWTVGAFQRGTSLFSCLWLEW